MIRAIALVLLVANLLFAVWLLSRPAPPLAPPAPPLGASPLVLLDEMPAAPPERQARTATPPPTDMVEPPPSTPVGCQALGPFMDRDTVVVARDRLVAAGIEALPRATDASERLGYWVHTPPGTAADASAIVTRLRRAGVRDFYVVTEGELSNAVSLGVFSEQATAERHAARMRSMGFEVELNERRRERTAWWLDFRVPAAGSAAADAVVRLVLDSDEALLLEPRVCD